MTEVKIARSLLAVLVATAAVCVQIVTAPDHASAEVISHSASLVGAEENSQDMIYPANPGAKTAGATSQATGTENGYPLTYDNGYIQHRPHVYLIFWGSEWNEKAGTREKLLSLFKWVSGSA